MHEHKSACMKKMKERGVGGGFIRETNRQIREELESLFSAFGRGYVGALAFRCFPIQLNKTQGHQTASHGFSSLCEGVYYSAFHPNQIQMDGNVNVNAF